MLPTIQFEYKCKLDLYANRMDPDQMLRFTASDQNINCLHLMINYH